MSTTTKARNAIFRTHRDIWPRTDHGYTWVEFCWFENEAGDRISATVPAAGCCERLGHLPGGPLPQYDYDFESRGFNVTRSEKTEETHKGSYRVGPVSITEQP